MVSQGMWRLWRWSRPWCHMTWWRLHSRTRLPRSVVPPSSRARRWWASQNAGGRVQPRAMQPRSRYARTRRWAVVISSFRASSRPGRPAPRPPHPPSHRAGPPTAAPQPPRPAARRPTAAVGAGRPARRRPDPDPPPAHPNSCSKQYMFWDLMASSGSANIAPVQNYSLSTGETQALDSRIRSQPG